MIGKSIGRNSLSDKKSSYTTLGILFSRQLSSRWTNTYAVVKMFPRGVIKIKDPTKDYVLKVNGHRLKYFLKMQREGEVECLFLYDPPLFR